MATEIEVNVVSEKSKVDPSIPAKPLISKNAPILMVFDNSYFRTTPGILKIVQLVRLNLLVFVLVFFFKNGFAVCRINNIQLLIYF